MLTFYKIKATQNGKPVNGYINLCKINWIEDKSATYALHMNNGDILEVISDDYMTLREYISLIEKY